MRLKVSNVCQLINKAKIDATKTVYGVTFTNDGSGVVVANGGPSTGQGAFYVDRAVVIDPTHIYLNPKSADIPGTCALGCDLYGDSGYIPGSENGFDRDVPFKFNSQGKTAVFYYVIFANKTVTNLRLIPQLFDLTEMYGAGNEPTTVAQFRQDFPNEMYEYSNVCWKKFRRLKYVTETKNLFNIHTEWDYPIASGTAIDLRITDNAVTGNILPEGQSAAISTEKLLIQKTTAGEKAYYISGETTGQNIVLIRLTDADGNLITTNSGYTYNQYYKAFLVTLNSVFYVQNNSAVYLQFGVRFAGTKNPVTFTNLQLELSSTASPYQPYGYLPLNRGKYIANKEPVQLLDKTKYRGTVTTEGITFTNNGDGTWTVVGTAPDDPINHSYVAYSILYFSKEFTQKYFIPGHKIVVGGGKVNYDAFVQWILGWTGGYIASNSSANYPYTITEYPENFSNYIELRVNKGKTVNFTFNPQFFDLTAMYGEGNEPTTVAQFRADYPNELYDYNPYNAITFR